MTTFYLTLTDASGSHVIAGSLFDKDLDTTAPASGTLNTGNLSAGSTSLIRAYSAAQPSVGSGQFIVNLEIGTGDTIGVRLQCHRINSSGTIQASNTQTGEQFMSTTNGSLTFTMSSTDLGTFGATDRLLVVFTLRSAVSHGNAAGSLDVGSGTTGTRATTPNGPSPTVVPVPVGSASFTGLVPTVLTPRTVTVPVGSMSFAGLAPSAILSTVINVPVGSVSFTGLAPAVVIADPNAIVVPTASMSFTGYAPTPVTQAEGLVQVPVNDGGHRRIGGDDFNRANETLTVSSDWSHWKGSTTGASIQSNYAQFNAEMVYWATHQGIDGFRIVGDVSSLSFNSDRHILRQDIASYAPTGYVFEFVGLTTTTAILEIRKAKFFGPPLASAVINKAFNSVFEAYLSDVGGDVRIHCYMDGVKVIDYLDDTNPITDSGYYAVGDSPQVSGATRFTSVDFYREFASGLTFRGLAPTVTQHGAAVSVPPSLGGVATPIEDLLQRANETLESSPFYEAHELNTVSWNVTSNQIVSSSEAPSAYFIAGKHDWIEARVSGISWGLLLRPGSGYYSGYRLTAASADANTVGQIRIFKDLTNVYQSPSATVDAFYTTDRVRFEAVDGVDRVYLNVYVNGELIHTYEDTTNPYFSKESQPLTGRERKVGLFNGTSTASYPYVAVDGYGGMTFIGLPPSPSNATAIVPTGSMAFSGFAPSVRNSDKRIAVPLLGGIGVASVFADDFNRTNEALDASSNWEELQTGLQLEVLSNAVSFSAGSATVGVFGIPESVRNYHDNQGCQATLSEVGGFSDGIGLAVRATAGQAVRLHVELGGYYFRLTDGTNSAELLNSPPLANGAVIRLEAEGTAVRAYLNNSLTLEITTALTGGQPGIQGRWSSGATVPYPILDGFTAYDKADGVTFTGLAPSVNIGKLVSVPTGTLTFTGLAPTVPQAVVVPVPVGSMAMTGLVPTVLAPRVVAVPVGAMTMTGLAPDVQTPNGIVVPVGAMTFTGLVPTVLAPRTVAVPIGSMTMTGLVPDVLTPSGLVIPTGAMSFTGLAPTVLTPVTIAVPLGSMSFTGLTPDALTSVTIPVPVGSMSFSGLAPTVNIVAGAINVPTGSLTFTGYAPYVGKYAHPTFRQKYGKSTDATTQSVPFPSSLPNGTLILLTYCFDNASGVSCAVTMPEGWTQIVYQPSAGVGTAGVYARRKDGTEPTNVDLTLANAQSGVIEIWGISGWYGELSAAIEVATGTQSTSTIADFPQVTPAWGSDDNLYIISDHSIDDGEVISSWPTGWDNGNEDWLTAGPSLDEQGAIASSWDKRVSSSENPGNLVMPTVESRFPITMAIRKFGGAAIAAVPTGSMTFTGLQPVATTGDNITVLVPAGAMTMTGLAPTVATPVAVAVPVGSMSFSGLAPTVLVSEVINVPAGSMSFSGLAPSVVVALAPGKSGFSYVVDNGLGITYFGVGAYQLDQPRFSSGNNVTVSVPAGSLTFTGLTPTVVNPHTVAVPVGAMSFTGFAPTALTPKTVSVPTGNMSFLGLAPTVLTPKIVPVPAGSMAFSGLAPSILTNVTVQVPAGSMTFTGFAPDIFNSSSVIVPTGSMSFTGLQPTVLLPQTVAVPAGSMAFSGLVPTALTPKTVAVPAGAMSFTGFAPTVVNPHTIAVPAGSMTMTGLAPTIVTPNTIPVPAGALSFTGFAPDALTPVAVQVPAGAMSITGLAPTVVTPRTVVVPTGSLTFTGQAPFIIPVIPTGSMHFTGFNPILQVGGNITIEPPKGTLTMTGLAPMVINPHTVAVPAGSMTFTGLAPTVTAPNTIPVPAGSMAITGYAPSVQTPVTVSVPAGSMTMTGFAPSVATPVTVPVPAGSMSFTGLAPEVLTPGAVIVPTGSMTFTGLQPIAITPRTIPVPNTALTFTGLAPAARIGNNVVVPTGSMTMTGQQPAVAFAWQQVIPAGSLTFTGLAPNVSVSDHITVDVPTASLSLVGYPPSALTPKAVDVPAGTLTMSGLAPSARIGYVVPTGSMQFTGYAPAVEVNSPVVINVPTGSMTFTGYAPIPTNGFIDVPIPVGSMVMLGHAPRAAIFAPATGSVVGPRFFRQYRMPRIYVRPAEPRVFVRYRKGRNLTYNPRK